MRHYADQPAAELTTTAIASPSTRIVIPTHNRSFRMSVPILAAAPGKGRGLDEQGSSNPSGAAVCFTSARTPDRPARQVGPKFGTAAERSGRS